MFFLSIHAMLLFAVSIDARPQRRMVGGSKSNGSRFSFAVAIFDCSKGGKNSSSLDCVHHCSGSLLSTRSVLTAGHCFVDSGVSTENMYALVGAEDYMHPGENSQFVKISKTVNRGYGANQRFPLDNDVGIAFLESEVTIATPHAQPIRLASNPSNDVVDCEELIVAGYGRSSNLPEEIRPSEGSLHVAHEYMHAPEVCIEANVQDRLDLLGATPDDPRYEAFNLRNREFFVKEKSLCFGGTSASNMCNGDSGAPIVVEHANGELVQVGITSFGLGTEGYCGPSLDYGTRVSAFSDWIAEQLQAENIDPSVVFVSWPLTPPVDSPEFTSTRCDEKSFQCKIVHKECVAKNQVCDGVKDCSDGSDEAKCEAVSEKSGRVLSKGQADPTKVKTGNVWYVGSIVDIKHGIFLFRKRPNIKGSKKPLTSVHVHSGGGMKVDQGFAEFDRESRTIQRGKTASDKYEGKDEMVFRIDPKKKGKSDAVVEVLKSPQESKVKYDDELVFDVSKPENSDKVITEKHGDHIDEIRFVRRRYGHKVVKIHKVPQVEEMKLRKKPLPIFKRSVLNDVTDATTAVPEILDDYFSEVTETDFGESEQVSVACLQSNLKMVSKRWEYVSGLSSVVDSESGHDNLTDIDAACEEMWQSCLNDNPALVLGVVGPSVGTVRDFCGSVSEYHNWTLKRDKYINEFGTKYNDKCQVVISEDVTITNESGLFPGPHNWALAFTQLFVIIALFATLVQRLRMRE